MLTISTALKGAASAKYYLKGEQVSYYQNIDSEPGRWLGRGAAKLGLHGKVEQMDLFHLWAGYAPDGGKALVQNAGDKDRDAAWDLTFSDPKSVSVLWGVGTPEIREAIDRARGAALKETLAWIEDNAGLSRRGKGGAVIEKAELVFAVFDHRTSRNLDPNTHAHALMINVGVRPDGTTGALATEEMFDLKMQGGERYRNSLERGLVQELQVQTMKDWCGFHVIGVARGLCEEMSSRRREIVAAMEERGVKGAVAAKVAALDTRCEKKQIPQEKLFAAWKKEADLFGWKVDRIYQHLKTKEPREKGPQQRKEQTTWEQEKPGPSGHDYFHRQEHRQETHEWTKPGSKQQTHREESKEKPAKPGKSKSQQKPQPKEQSFFLKPGEKPPGFIRAEWRYLVPKAPDWSPVSKWKVPKIVIGWHKPTWGHVHKRRVIGNVVIKTQQKFLFPKAPKWSPLYKVSLPAWRFQTVAGELKRKRLWERRHMGEPFMKKPGKREQAERVMNRGSKGAESKKSQGMNQGR